MKILITTLISVLLATCVFGQQKVTPDDPKWIRIESTARDFSVSFPETGYLMDNEDKVNRLHFLSDKTVIRVDMTAKSGAKDDFWLSYKLEKEKKYSFAETGDFLISQFIGENNKEHLNTFWLHLASSKGSYLISASTKDPADYNFARFISSIRVGGQSPYTSKTPFPAESKSISISSLTTDAVILDALRKPDSNQAKLERANDSGDPDEVRNYSRPLVILRRPKVGTDSAFGRVIDGTVRLRVTFLANGEIGKIVLIKPLDPALDTNAFHATRKIKFLPAEIDGKAVDVTKTLEYSFSKNPSNLF